MYIMYIHIYIYTSWVKLLQAREASVYAISQNHTKSNLEENWNQQHVSDYSIIRLGEAATHTHTPSEISVRNVDKCCQHIWHITAIGPQMYKRQYVDAIPLHLDIVVKVSAQPEAIQAAPSSQQLDAKQVLTSSLGVKSPG